MLESKQDQAGWLYNSEEEYQEMRYRHKAIAHSLKIIKLGSNLEWNQWKYCTGVTENSMIDSQFVFQVKNATFSVYFKNTIVSKNNHMVAVCGHASFNAAGVTVMTADDWNQQQISLWI